MTIKVLDERGATGAEIARLLGVSDGTVRYNVRHMKAGAVDGRSAHLRIPGHPVAHSNDIRSGVPGYPVTLSARV